MPYTFSKTLKLTNALTGTEKPPGKCIPISIRDFELAWQLSFPIDRITIWFNKCIIMFVWSISSSAQAYLGNSIEIITKLSTAFISVHKL